MRIKQIHSRRIFQTSLTFDDDLVKIELQKFTNFLTNFILIIGENTTKSSNNGTEQSGLTTSHTNISASTYPNLLNVSDSDFALSNDTADLSLNNSGQNDTSIGPQGVSYVTIPTSGGPVIVPLPEGASETTIVETTVVEGAMAASTTTEVITKVTTEGGNVLVTRSNVTKIVSPEPPTEKGSILPELSEKISGVMPEVGDLRDWFGTLPLWCQVVAVCGALWSIVFIPLAAFKLGRWTTMIHIAAIARDFMSGSLNQSSVVLFIQSLIDRSRQTPVEAESPAQPPSPPTPRMHQEIHWVSKIYFILKIINLNFIKVKIQVFITL